MGQPLWPEVVKAVPNLFIALLTLTLGRVIGHRSTAKWDERKKRREPDLPALDAFYSTYGKSFAIWKTWDKYSGDPAALPELRTSLLERSSTAEGEPEALIVRVAAERRQPPGVRRPRPLPAGLPVPQRVDGGREEAPLAGLPARHPHPADLPLDQLRITALHRLQGAGGPRRGPPLRRLPGRRTPRPVVRGAQGDHGQPLGSRVDQPGVRTSRPGSEPRAGPVGRRDRRPAADRPHRRPLRRARAPVRPAAGALPRPAAPCGDVHARRGRGSEDGGRDAGARRSRVHRGRVRERAAGSGGGRGRGRRGVDPAAAPRGVGGIACAVGVVARDGLAMVWHRH